jgi:hypothetical protein
MANDPPFQDGRKAPADRFNFGEFRDGKYLFTLVLKDRAGDGSPSQAR